MDITWLFQGDDVMQAEKLAIRNTHHQPEAQLRATLRDVAGGRLKAPLHAVPVGTVEFTLAVMGAHGIRKPAPFCYPDVLSPLLDRRIVRGRYGDAAEGQFVKPAGATKLFTGHIKGDPAYADELVRVLQLEASDVWISEPVRFVAEARHYILNDQCLGWSRYDENEDKIPDPDPAVALTAVRLMAGTSRPCGYTVDVGLTDDGRSLVVECNDGWALGFYGSDTMSEQSYAHLIAMRWLEIAGRSLEAEQRQFDSRCPRPRPRPRGDGSPP
jgi:hypothetical protein